MKKSKIAPVVRLSPSPKSDISSSRAALSLEAQDLMSRIQVGEDAPLNFIKKWHPAGDKPQFAPSLMDARMALLFHSMSAKKLSFQRLKKEAKKLLKDLRENQELAIVRLQQHPKLINAQKPISEMVLADCQHVIALENGFDSWPKLKHHIQALDHYRQLTSKIDAPDDIHIRCGSDIKAALEQVGFQGKFTEIINPFSYGPVVADTDARGQQLRADIIDADFGEFLEGEDQPSLTFIQKHEQQTLEALGQNHGEVVLWFEHDAYDQLCLSYVCHHLSQKYMPLAFKTSLVQVDNYPGIKKFIGLGNISPDPENWRLLYDQRIEVTAHMIAFGARVWDALCDTSPKQLHQLAHEENTPLPLMQGAILRILQELPDVKTGLSLTEKHCLNILKDEGTLMLRRVFLLQHAEYDPQPYLGDIMFFAIVKKLLGLKKTPLKIVDKLDTPGPATEIIALTDYGRQLLLEEANLLTDNTVQRWVCGTEINSQFPSNWCWCPNTNTVVKK